MKKIKSEGAVKSNTPYKMKFIKKVATIASAVVLSAALFLGAAFTLTGCNNEKDPIDPNPPIVDVDPDDGKEDPDDGKGDPDDGKEDPDDGKEDPDDGKEDPDDGKEDPEEEIPWTPLEPAYNPIDTLEELYETKAPNLDDFTQEKYGENYKEFYNNEVKEYNEAQAMQEKIYENLEANVKEKIGMFVVGANKYQQDKTSDTKWEIEAGEDNKTIEKVRLFFTYNTDNEHKNYYIGTVIPETNITITDLAENNVDYDETFKIGRNGATFEQEYGFSYNTSEQQTYDELLDAINNKIETNLKGEIQSLIKANGGSTSSELGGTANNYSILNIGENSIEEFSITIRDSSTGKSEIENLQNGLYRASEQIVKEYNNQYLNENSGNEHMDEIQIDNQQTKKSAKYVAKISLPKEDGTVEEYEFEL